MSASVAIAELMDNAVIVGCGGLAQVALMSLKMTRERAAFEFDRRMADRPKRLDQPDDIDNPDVLIGVHGGSEARGAGASGKTTQFASRCQYLLAERIGWAFAIPDLRVGVINTFTEAEMEPSSLELRVFKLRERVRGMPLPLAGSVLLPGAVQLRRPKERFLAGHFKGVFGMLTYSGSEAEPAIGNAPLLLVTPHDISDAPGAPWWIKGLWRTWVTQWSDDAEDLALQFNADSKGHPIAVYRSDKDLKPALAGEPEKYFYRPAADYVSRSLGINPVVGLLSDAGHDLLAQRVSRRMTSLLIARWSEDTRRGWPPYGASPRLAAAIQQVAKNPVYPDFPDIEFGDVAP